MDEIVMACVERVTQEYIWQRRISRGECPLCGKPGGCRALECEG